MNPQSEGVVDWRWKGFPPELADLPFGEAIAQGFGLLTEDFPMPVALLNGRALDHNIRAMQAFANDAGVALCPHGKTTMSPELFDRQLAAGAWGMTAATAHHVRLYRSWGVNRILLANQLVAKADITVILDELAHEDFDFFCLVDSEDGVRRLADAVRQKGLTRPLNVLIEIGSNDGRSGVRSVEAGFTLAKSIAREAEVLALRGIELFEGIHPFSGDGPAAVGGMLDDVARLARDVAAADLFASGEILLTGGGSALFDLCTHRLKAIDLNGQAKIILRSGCYVTHDDGTYAAAIEAIRARQPSEFVQALDLEAALEVWAVVLSVPEPDFAVVGLGKRDAGYDADLPRPLWQFTPGETAPRRVTDTLRVNKLYDQHACLHGAAGLTVGDFVGFGISHPCSTFDRWRAMPVVDESYRMVDLVTTVF